MQANQVRSQGDERLPEPARNVPGVTIRDERQRGPLHHIPLDINGHSTTAFLLRSIDPRTGSARDTLTLFRPADIHRLPTASQKEWETFSAELKHHADRWCIGAVPTLKRAYRLYREGRLFQGYQLRAVAHRYGAVPALVVGYIGDYALALTPERLPRVARGEEYSDGARLEILLSLQDLLPHLLTAYYEQIAFYLQSIFFGASDRHAIAYCLRIRQIVMNSIRTKLAAIDKCPARMRNAYRLAAVLGQQYERELREARAIDAFAHLLVNYVHRFYCLKDRVPDYSARIRAIRSSGEMFSADPIGILKRCTANLQQPEDGFLEAIQADARGQPAWLVSFVDAAGFVAEILRFTRGRPPDRPRIFATYHFKVSDAEQFVDELDRRLEQDGITELIQGRKVGRNIRWSLLARLWFADHQVLFLPSTWLKSDGRRKDIGGRVIGWFSNCCMAGFLTRGSGSWSGEGARHRWSMSSGRCCGPTQRHERSIR